MISEQDWRLYDDEACTHSAQDLADAGTWMIIAKWQNLSLPFLILSLCICAKDILTWTGSKWWRRKRWHLTGSTNLCNPPTAEEIVGKYPTGKTQQNKSHLALESLAYVWAKLGPLHNLHSSHLELFIQVHDLGSYLWTLVHVAPSEWFLSNLMNSHLFFRQKRNISLMSCLTRNHTPIICLLCYFLSLYILILWHLS